MSDAISAMKRKNVLILGSINTDYVVKGPRLPRPGETIIGGSFVEARGGKGANQAVAAARAGAIVTMIGAVGNDVQGSAAINSMLADGICTEYIHCISDVASGVALILVDEQGENCISVASGANAMVSAADITQVPDRVFMEAAVFLTNHEIPLDAVIVALRRAKSLGLRTVLNPAPAELRLVQDNTMLDVDIITPNETEASLLTNTEVTSLESAIIAARKLQSMGPQTVIITMGKAGCILFDAGNEPVHVPAPKVAAADTTAAGDAFNGALCAALAEGRTVLVAAKWATQAASLSVTKIGAQPSLPYRSEILGGGGVN